MASRVLGEAVASLNKRKRSATLEAVGAMVWLVAVSVPLADDFTRGGGWLVEVEVTVEVTVDETVEAGVRRGWVEAGEGPRAR